MCQRIGNMPKACPYVIAFSFMVNSVDYRKNTERNTTKIPNETPQKYRMDYHDVLETDIVLLLIKFERLMGEGRLGFAELLGGEAGVLLEVAAEE